MTDLRFAFRQLLKHPGYTGVAVLLLALGIGANTAIYSVLSTVLFDPLPGSSGDRLIQIAERMYRQGGFSESEGQPSFHGVAPPALEAILRQRDLFESVTWTDSAQFERRTDDFREVVFGQQVAPNFFATFGVAPAMGRTFATDEAVPVNTDGVPVRDSVVVLSHSGWQSLLGGDPEVLGRTIELSGARFTVIGVMPRSFRFPNGGTQFWFPSEIQQLPEGWATLPNTLVYARLQPGVTTGQVQAFLDTTAAQLTAAHENRRGYIDDWRRRPGGLGFWVRPAAQFFADGRDDLRKTLYGLFGAIGFILLIVCANVANLALFRTEQRQQELTIRAALGAGRLRLMKLLLAESVLLACVGGVLGMAVSYWGTRVLTAIIPEFMPTLKQPGIDLQVLGFTMVVSVATGLAFGMAPALQAGRRRLAETLKQAGVNASTAARRTRFRRALVVMELALTLVLLTGAGLMLESVARLLRVDPGFDPENLLRVDIHLPWDRYNDLGDVAGAAELRRVVFANIHEQLSALPGVTAVGLGKHGAWPEKLKLDDTGEEIEVLAEGTGIGSHDLFQAMRIPLLAGRYLEPRDAAEGSEAVLVNETMARMYWPAGEAVGKRFSGRIWRDVRNFEVVGVVGDVRDYKFDQQVRPAYFRPCHELNLQGLRPFFVVRSTAPPESLIPAIRGVLAAVEPGMQKPEIVVSKEVLYESTRAQRTYMLYLVVFAATGLALSALGIYGVLAYSVARRTKEIGIRMALGAGKGRLLNMILGEGLRLAVMGTVVGLLASWYLTRLIQHQLFGVQPTEPFVYGVAALLLVSIALLACLIPARRAIKVHPMEALRCE